MAKIVDLVVPNIGNFKNVETYVQKRHRSRIKEH